MKLLLSLLLLLFITLVKSQNSGNCFTKSNPLSSFATVYQSIGLDVNSNDNGNITKASYSEQGLIAINFKSQLLYNSFSVIANDNLNTNFNVYAYGSNNTQYIVINNEKCYMQKVDQVIPSDYSIGYVNSSWINLGDIPVEVYEINTNSLKLSKLSQLLYVNKNTCAFMTSSIYNTDSNGRAIINFIDFSTHNDPRYFVLPSICYNSSTYNSKLNIGSILFK